MELKEALLERRSIRGFRQEPVDQEILREVLRLAGYAVSANNAQPWAQVSRHLSWDSGTDNVIRESRRLSAVGNTV